MRYAKIKWKEIPTNLSRCQTNTLKNIQQNNLEYIDYLARTEQGLSAYAEEQYYTELGPLQAELDKRKEMELTVSKKENTMRADTKKGIKIALQSLASKSIRKACQDGGISVTTLYNKTTPAQREAALKGKYVQKVGVRKGRGPGRPKVVPNESVSIPTEQPIDHQYVAKLERALLKRFLDNEE